MSLRINSESTSHPFFAIEGGTLGSFVKDGRDDTPAIAISGDEVFIITGSIDSLADLEDKIHDAVNDARKAVRDAQNSTILRFHAAEAERTQDSLFVIDDNGEYPQLDADAACTLVQKWCDADSLHRTFEFIPENDIQTATVMLAWVNGDGRLLRLDWNAGAGIGASDSDDDRWSIDYLLDQLPSWQYATLAHSESAQQDGED